MDKILTYPRKTKLKKRKRANTVVVILFPSRYRMANMEDNIYNVIQDGIQKN